MTFRLVTHSDCLHLSNTQLRARQKTELLKLHNGLWCRVCAPYGYVPLSHLGNIVLTNEIATFHNGGISSSKCATLIISVFHLLQKILKNVLSIPNTVIILNIGKDRFEQTVQTQIRLLLMEQSDQGLLCLLFCLHLLNTILHCKIQLFQL